MCLIALSYNTHPRYKLILATNRDEFYERPTREAQFWREEGHPDIFAGKDLKGKGTWLGVHRGGKWGALTNYRDPALEKSEAPTRGNLVLNYLKSDLTAQAYLHQLKGSASDYNGFNLLLGDEDGIYHFSNINEEITELEPGIHGLSNALLNTPWPKLERAKLDLATITNEANFDHELLFKLLHNDRRADDKALPTTGIPLKWEKAISSIFIKTDTYGTRCSSILLIDYQGGAKFIERRFEAKTGEIRDEHAFELVFS